MIKRRHGLRRCRYRGADGTARWVGLGVIAVVMAILFGGLAVAAFANGEVFIGVMAGIGALMTVWAAGSSLRRG